MFPKENTLYEGASLILLTVLRAPTPLIHKGPKMSLFICFLHDSEVPLAISDPTELAKSLLLRTPKVGPSLSHGDSSLLPSACPAPGTWAQIKRAGICTLSVTLLQAWKQGIEGPWGASPWET